MHYHTTHRTLVILSTLWMLLSSSYLIILFVSLRRLKRRIKELLDVFDPGTAFLGDDFVFGLYQGRPAWVSRQSRTIQIGLKGHFSLPFEVQNFNSRRSAMTRDTFWWAAIVAMFFFGGTDGGRYITVWTLLGPSIWALMPAISALVDLRHRSASSIARIDMSLAATRLTPFETRLPDRLRAALDKPEIREPLACIFDSCQADGIKAQGEMEAFWRLPRRVLDISLLNTGTVRGMLTELLTLCAGAEQAFPDATRI
jgi:hypothetical protein